MLLPWGFLSSHSMIVQREGRKCLWTLVRCTRARFLLLGSFTGRGSGSSSLAVDSCCRFAPSSVASPLSSLHALRGDESRESSEAAPVHDTPVLPGLRLEKHGRIVVPALGRVALVTGLVARALAPLPARGQEVEKVVGVTRLNCCLSVSGRGVIDSGLLTVTIPVAFTRLFSWCDWSRSSDHYRPHRDHSCRDQPRSSDRYRSRRERSRSHVRQEARRDRPRSSDRCQLRRERLRSHVRQGARRDWSRSCDSPHRPSDRLQSRERSLLSSDRSRSPGRSWQTRRAMREGVETVAVSQAPVVSETSAAVAPPVAVGAAAVFPPAMQDLARFFLKPDGILVPASGCGWCGCVWFCIRGGV